MSLNLMTRWHCDIKKFFFEKPTVPISKVFGHRPLARVFKWYLNAFARAQTNMWRFANRHIYN